MAFAYNATVAFELVKVFSDFGYPTKSGMDNGSEMKNMIMKLLCESMHIDQRLITPYKASSNGASDCWVQLAKLAIAKIVKDAGHQWDLFTPGVQLALKNKVSKRLKTPPFNLMFARKMNAFVDHRTSDKCKKSSVMTYDQLIDRINVMPKVVFPAIMDKTNTYVDKMKNKYDKFKNLVNDFEKDTPVMVRIPTLEGSLTPSYMGPYTVVRKTKGGSYVLADKTGLLMDRDYAPSELKVISQNNL
ncbi:hypothetical protein [Parasitella parasitica]|uniref:Integrase catalytic domain-containing protein n=1 Tax=Parasitella parasitica TaxID=35722 RepID=A0A0B7MUN1_9FUNG|nr:hypothetical protein [Parasitella parasitica]